MMDKTVRQCDWTPKDETKFTHAYVADLLMDKQAARMFLCKVGILGKSGKFTKHYQELEAMCVQA
jgi:hypothetical protein